MYLKPPEMDFDAKPAPFRTVENFIVPPRRVFMVRVAKFRTKMGLVEI